LKLNKYPHPKSYVFYELEDLYKQSRGFNYPIVYKASSGSGSSGVRIVDNIGDLEKLAKKVFYRGIRTYRQHKLDKEFGYMILQEYLHNVKEWRIIRIGDYYFGFEKIKSGDFHSGSHVFGYGMPPIKCLEISKQITDKYKFLCISIDIFITDDSCVYINELQPYFGQKDDRELLIINDEPGRLYWDSNEKKWVFEKGEYCRNNLSNLRISEIIKKIKK